MSKIHANKGVPRNKKPLRNTIYTVTLNQLKADSDKDRYAKYMFKDKGYITLAWELQGSHGTRNWHGFVTPEDLKSIIGEEQWRKFCQGKREFTIQRRVNGKNTKILNTQ